MPNRLVRIRTTSPVSATLWTGYTNRIVPQPSLYGADLAVIEAVGPLAVIAQRKVRTRMS